MKRYFLLLFAGVLTSCAGRLPVIGWHPDTGWTHAFYQRAHYKKAMERGLEYVATDIAPSLAHSESGKSPFTLSQIRLAVGIKAEFGLGPLKAGISPRFRVALDREKTGCEK